MVVNTDKIIKVKIIFILLCNLQHVFKTWGGVDANFANWREFGKTIISYFLCVKCSHSILKFDMGHVVAGADCNYKPVVNHRHTIYFIIPTGWFGYVKHIENGRWSKTMSMFFIFQKKFYRPSSVQIKIPWLSTTTGNSSAGSFVPREARDCAIP